MTEFIANPRRAPRAPARCRAAVLSSAGSFQSETEDIGATGCQLVSPSPVPRGDLLQLVFSNEKVEGPLMVNGRVAWCSPRAPWRVGVAFEDGSRRESARWFEALVAAHPGMASYRRVPDRIRADAVAYLGPPPRFLLDFTRDEAALLRAIGSGVRVDELMARLRDRAAGAQRALFSLLARQAIVLQRGQSVHPESWKRILAQVEASLAVEALDGGRPPRAGARDAPASASAELPAASTPEPAGERRSATPVPSAPARPRELSLATDDAEPSAARGWRQSRIVRSPAAQEVFERAVAAIRMGANTGALVLLHEALALAPGDPEIEDVLARLEPRGRPPRP